MIQSFSNAGTEDIYFRKNTKDARKTLDVSLHRVAKRKLDQLTFSVRLEDLRAPPGNRLEALHGDREGFYSIRINDQWRIVFKWAGDGPTDVAIVDYHRG
jgi:proteic killer suppression protein